VIVEMSHPLPRLPRALSWPSVPLGAGAACSQPESGGRLLPWADHIAPCKRASSSSPTRPTRLRSSLGYFPAWAAARSGLGRDGARQLPGRALLRGGSAALAAACSWSSGLTPEGARAVRTPRATAGMRAGCERPPPKPPLEGSGDEAGALAVLNAAELARQQSARMLARAVVITKTAQGQAVGTLILTASAVGWTVSTHWLAPLALVWSLRFLVVLGAAVQLFALVWSNGVFIRIERSAARSSTHIQQRPKC